MRSRMVSVLLLLGLAACAVPPEPPQPALSPPAPLAAAPAPRGHAAVSTIPPSSPPTRPDLGRQWFNPEGKLRYPPDDGFAGHAVFVVLPPGVLLDRFGEETGRFFSPKGASHSGRALPSVCTSQSYAVYRVRVPLPAWAGTAVRWFGEPGGATQFKTDTPAAMLLADGTLERVPDQGTPPCR